MSILKDWRSYPEGREKYQLYLASREWAVLKEQVRARSGGTCERCHHKPGQQVHHQTYERKYRETLGDLVHLCAPCHEFVSGKLNEDPVRKVPIRVNGTEISDVYLPGGFSIPSWRDQLLPEGWEKTRDFISPEGKHVKSFGCGLTIPDGRRFVFCGPFNGYLNSSFWDEALACYPKDLPAPIDYWLARTDLVFTWVDSLNWLDVISELSVIKSFLYKHCPIVVVLSEGWKASTPWASLLLYGLAQYGLVAKSPKEAWDSFWQNPEAYKLEP